MQENEQSTLKKILSIAKEEFLKKGFTSASLRSIVKKAGVTTGAFYGYFKSKEELFDALVEKDAHYLESVYDNIFSEFMALDFDSQIKNMEQYSYRGITLMFDYAWEHKATFRLIIECSAGTKHNHFLENLVQKEIDSTKYFYNVLEAQGAQPNRTDDIVENLITKSLFSAFANLILSDITKEEAKRSLDQLFAFYCGGWNSLMRTP